ncbi:MAG TPA: transporter [Thermodesulfovibrionales bacterium]|nr:transporter [Thermodesulfovibrionales bacterium]
MLSLRTRVMLMHRNLRETLYVVCLFFFLLYATNIFAAIPLITDDTGTQGKGNFQFELFGEYGHESEPLITTKTGNVSATLTYGIIDTVDIIFGIPYQAWNSKNSDSESVVKGDGLADLSLEAKWRFYEKEGLSFALKPGFTVPTGDTDKGLGAGRPTYHLLLLATKQMKPWQFDMNIGYLYNENTAGERKNIWSASVDAQCEVVKDLKLVLDTGVATNPDSSSDTPPVYILGGLIWSVRENLDIGLGIKGGLTNPETDIAVRGGITWRF